MRRRALFGVALAGAILAGASVSPSAATNAPGLVDGAPVANPEPAVVLIGDSITALNMGTVEQQLQAHAVPSWRVAAQTGRRTTQTLVGGSTTIASGLDAVTAVRAAGVDPELWVIALGTNDLGTISSCGCADRRAFARQRVRAVLDAIGPGHHVAWVTVRHAGYPGTAVLFNDVVRTMTLTDPHLTVIDWYALSAGRSAWLPDGIHPSLPAAAALFGEVAEVVAGLLPRWVIPPTTAPTGDVDGGPSSTLADVGPGTHLDAASPAVRLATPVLPVGGATILDQCGRVAAGGAAVSISPGSTGAKVVAVQCALAAFGLDPGPVDGTFSSDTKAAVLQFQLHLGLYGSGSGTVGTATAHALGVYAAP